MATPTFPQLSEARMQQLLEPPGGQVRLIIDTDTHNEIDDQFALAWALLSQDRLQIEGIVAEPYSFAHHRPPLLKTYDLLKADPTAAVPERLRQAGVETDSYVSWAQNLLQAGVSAHDIPFVSPTEGMELSYREILTVFEKLDEDPADRVFRGSEHYLESLDTPIRSPAAEYIIQQALANEDRPLYVAAIGCITNIASAILLEPQIIQNMVVLWTSAYPSCSNLCNASSLNLVQDPLASRLLFDCGVPHVYLPGFHVGAQLLISLPDMERWVQGKGKIGHYLHQLYTQNPIHTQRGITDFFGRTWVIWDIINIAWLLNPGWVPSQLVRSPILNDHLHWEHHPKRHLMREAHGVNRDAIFRDFFTKLEQAP